MFSAGGEGSGLVWGPGARCCPKERGLHGQTAAEVFYIYWATGVCLSCTTKWATLPHSSICSSNCRMISRDHWLGRCRWSLGKGLAGAGKDGNGQGARPGSDCTFVCKLGLSRYPFLCLCFTTFKMSVMLLLLGCRTCLMGFVKSFETFKENERGDEGQKRGK